MRSGLLLALPLVFAAAVPVSAQQTSTTTTAFDAWVLGCSSRTQADNKTVKACEIRSTIVIRDEKSNQQGVAAVVAIGRASVDKPDMQFVTQLPINAVLNVPVRITSKDDKPVIELAFVACQPQLCTASVNVTDKQISALKKIGDNFHVAYRNQAGQDVKIEGSTKGFNQALDALVREK